jgi:hypothetical protein
MKRLIFLPPLFLLIFLFPVKDASGGQWVTKICQPNSGFQGIPFAVKRNVISPGEGLPQGMRALDCDYRGGYNIGNNYSNRFFGVEQSKRVKYKASLAFEWEELPESTLLLTSDFVPGGFYMRVRNGVQACFWIRTDFLAKYSWSCLGKKGIRTSSKFGKLIRASRNIKVKKNRSGKVVERSGFYTINKNAFRKINNEVFGDRSYRITLALGIQCLAKKGCSSKRKPQMIWKQINFLNKETRPPFINPEASFAIEHPESVPDPGPLVRVARNNNNSLAGELKCPLRETAECIETYGSQMIGATDMPLYDKGAGLQSLVLKNSKSEDSTAPFQTATVNGNNALSWHVSADGSYLFQNCSTSGFFSSCPSALWGIRNFEIRSKISEEDYNLNGANRLRVCAYDRKELPSGKNTPGLETCVTANDSFVLDNEGPSADILLPEDRGTDPYSGDVVFRAKAKDVALGVASLQFKVQETDFLGNPLGPVVSVGELIEEETPPNTEGTYEATIDTTTLSNGIYRVLATAKDKQAFILGEDSKGDFASDAELDYLIYVEN